MRRAGPGGQPGGQIRAERGGPAQRLHRAASGRWPRDPRTAGPAGPRARARPGAGCRPALRAARPSARRRAERIVGGGLRVAEDTGQQPADRLHHDQHRGLAAGQHVVPDGHLVDRHPVARLVDHPRVDPLVPAAGKDQPSATRPARPPSPGVNGRPEGVGTPAGPVAGPGAGHRVQRLAPRFRRHHHARAAAERGVVHRAVHVVGPGPQVVHLEVDVPAGGRLAEQRDAERGEVVGEDRDDVDAHRAHLSPGLAVPRRPARAARAAGR